MYALGDPIKYDDPDGEIANAVIGGVIGGLLGGLGSVAAQAISGGEINWHDVGACAAGGAVSGALAGATLGLSLVAQAGTAGVVGVAATTNAVGGAVTRALDTSPETKPADAREAAIDVATGAAGGVVGAKIQQLVKTPLPQVERQVQASQPAARRGNFGASQSVKGHQAQAEKIRTRAAIASTVAGAKTTNVVVPAARATLQRKRTEEQK